MASPPRPQLDLAAILATKVFTEDDLAHNRRGVLSPAQEVWRATHPRFMVDDDGHGGAVEPVLGRVGIEGRYVADRMGRTTFAELVLPGRRLSLRPGMDRRLTRGAPYRAYAAYGWVWSVEPITEDELSAATSELATYRSPDDPSGRATIARALADVMAIELSFSDGDVAANMSGRFSPGQRSLGRKKLVFAISRLVVSSAAVLGLVTLLDTGVPFPILATFLGIVALFLFWVTSAWALVDALARVVKPKPLCAIARLDNDPTNRDNVVFEIEGRPVRIKRTAFTIAEAPFSALRAWRFEVHYLPWTRSILTVRPMPPSDPR